MKPKTSSDMTPAQALAALEEAAKYKTENRLRYFKPYPRQAEFIAAGATKRERLLMAGNQVGKSECGAYETAMHLTGLYPKDWKGRRFKKPVKCWALGETSIVVRDVQQKKLAGEPGVEASFGSGMIPRSLFVDKPSLARGVTDAFDTVQVRHASGGVSVVRFKSYEQGRAKLQGETIDFAWLDEEADETIYNEVVARLTGSGMVFTTFTPLKGMSAVVRRFTDEVSAQRQVVSLPLSDVTHFTEEEKRLRVEGYAAHERKAREMGEPLLGSGAVYPFSEERITEPQILALPRYFRLLWAIDIGISHPFAAVLGGWDPETDTWHILHTIKMADAIPMMHAAAMKQIAANVPVCYPHDATQRDKGSGDPISQIYRRYGLNMLHQHSTWEDGGYSREAAVLELTDRAGKNQFKVASHLSDWLLEFRRYHRKDGQIVRIEDDLMSATEKLLMMRRFARAVPLGSKVVKRRGPGQAAGCDDEYWGM